MKGRLSCGACWACIGLYITLGGLVVQGETPQDESAMMHQTKGVNSTSTINECLVWPRVMNMLEDDPKKQQLATTPSTALQSLYETTLPTISSKPS